MPRHHRGPRRPGGPVYLNGKQARLKKYSDSAYDATGAGVTVSITINPDGSPSLMYTGKRGAHGVCQLTSGMPAAAPGNAAPPADNVAVKDMARYCAGEASAKFQVRPQYIKTQAAKKDHGMYTVLGKVPDSGVNFACTFSTEGKLVGVDKM